MSEVTKSSENQENSVLALTEEAEAASVAEVEPAASPADPKVSADAAAAEDTVSPKVDNKKTPAKRTPSKRMSFIERAQKESEELVKNLGGSLELDGGRRTRSSTRGTPTRSSVVATPPPAKKARSSPATAASSSTSATTPSRRVRGRKIDTSVEPESTEAEGAATKEENKKPETEEETSSEDQPPTAATDNNDSEKSSVENAENTVVDAANSAAAAEEAEQTAIHAKKQEDEKAVDAVDNEKDEADAALESIPEEKQNNIDHNSKETGEKPIESPLVPSKNEADSKESVTLSPTKVAGTANIAKLPTPEPMEVDSSNSKDANEVECMDEDVTETSTLPKVTAKIVTNQIAAGAAKVDLAKEGAAAAVVDTNSVKTVIVNDLKSVAAPEIVDVLASGEPKATEAAKPTNATSEVTKEHQNKSENDFSEPKIVSPSTEGAVKATPQYCN